MTFAACAAIAGATLGACAPSTTTSGTEHPTMSSDHPTDSGHDLRAKPSLEAAQAEYRALVTRMADGIAALTPGTTWHFDETSWIACTGQDVAAKQAYVMAVFSGPIPDRSWPDALRIVTDEATAHGATVPGTVKDAPGDHDANVSGTDGVEFRLGTQKASTLSAKSDCRLGERDAPTTTGGAPTG